MPPAADAHSARLARDDRLALEAQQRIHIANRWALIPLSLALALVAGTADSIGAPLVPLAALPALNAVVTGAAHLLLKRGRFAVWHFRALAFWDAATFAAVALLLGPYGYFVLPLIVFAATQSTSLYPAAGRDFALAAVPAYAAARASADGAVWVAVVIESVLLAGICAVTYAREASLVRRLAAVRVALGRVERGDLTVRLRDGVRDNVGLLSASLNRTVGSLRRLVGEIQGQAGGLAGLAENLAATAQEVEASAGEIGYVSGSIADEAERQLAVVAEGRTRADEAARSSRALGEQAVSSSAAARLLAGEAAAQGEQIRRTAELLLALGEGHRKSAASMAELEGAGGQVSGFASAIRAIAAQTDLLALNAAIEAARAGELGLGFGVVADEVRRLAVRSTDSAGSIAEVVARTQKAIVQMRERLGAESERIEKAGEVADKGRAALASVLEGLERTVAFIERIAADARAQSGAMEHLHAGMGEIDGIARSVVERTRQGASAAEHQAAAMEQLSAGSQQLADVALRLRTLAGRFRVGNGAGKKAARAEGTEGVAAPAKQGGGRALAAVR